MDKWLWAARFFKTRSIAADAISKNRVRIDGQRIKPSRTLQVGNTVQIEKPPYRFDVTVLGLNDKRRPASEAALLYQESEESIAARDQARDSLRIERQLHVGLAGVGRPTKKQRRQIIRFQNVNDAAEAESTKGHDDQETPIQDD